MYLFGTFSAQYALKIAPSLRPFRARVEALAGGEIAPPAFAHRGADLASWGMLPPGPLSSEPRLFGGVAHETLPGLLAITLLSVAVHAETIVIPNNGTEVARTH